MGVSFLPEHLQVGGGGQTESKSITLFTADNETNLSILMLNFT